MEECIDMKKMWYIHIREYYLAFIKKKKKKSLVICYHIDEISQSQKDTSYMIPLTQGI